MIRQVGPAVEIDVRVVPRAKTTELAGVRGDAILVRLAAPPVEGAANDALVTFLASLIRIPRSHIHIVAGGRSRRKRVRIDAVSADSIRATLGA